MAAPTAATPFNTDLPNYKNLPKLLVGQTALVTGANSGIGQAVLAPRLGSKRLSDGALMSTQKSTCSAADHTGHSPRLARASSTQRGTAASS